MIAVNAVYFKEFLVQIHRVDKKYVEVLEFFTFQECQPIRDVLYGQPVYPKGGLGVL